MGECYVLEMYRSMNTGEIRRWPKKTSAGNNGGGRPTPEVASVGEVRELRALYKVFRYAVAAASLLDRLLDHAIFVEITSNCYRPREHAKLVLGTLRMPPVSIQATPNKRRSLPQENDRLERTATTVVFTAP